MQAIFFGGVLNTSGEWNFMFACIVGMLVVMIEVAVVAGASVVRARWTGLKNWSGGS